MSLGINVDPVGVIEQMKVSGVHRCMVFPFPSMALRDSKIIGWVVDQCRKYRVFYPFYYVLNDLKPVPSSPRFVGVKWHWVRGISDFKSNYDVLKDEGLHELVDSFVKQKLPVIFEEELDFTKKFVKMFPDVTLIIPHLGMLGGAPLDFLEEFKGCENVFFDTSLAPASILEGFIREIGVNRVIYGSDIPFGSIETEKNKMLRLNLRDEDMELILGRNILSLVGENLKHFTW